MSYLDIYQKRLNRFGDDYFSRIQGKREKNFELYLTKTTCRIDFEFENEIHPGSFERYQQTASKTLHYLLTRVGLNLPSGTILDITSVDGISDKWMVFWKDNIQATGYDRYVMLRMSHYLKAGRRAFYSEDNESRFVIMPINKDIKQEDYVTIGEGDFVNHFRVTGYEYESVDGIMYVTLDPIYERDFTPVTVNPSDSRDYWFGGNSNA